MKLVPQRDEADLLLFVTGDAPRSERARRNLDAALEAWHLQADVTICEVDLLDHPRATLDYGIFATPALLQPRASGDHAVIYGDLSDVDRLNAFLDSTVAHRQGS